MTKLLFNPQEIAIESIAGEAAIAAERLNADWLRQRFAHPPAWGPEVTDEQRTRLTAKSAIPASVLIPIVLREEGPTLLLTQRTTHLHDHAGQVSFPGGRVDPVDSSLIDTALRETEEEVGLHRRHIEVIGTLPDYFTGTGYCVTPVVAIVQPPFDLRADPFEVAEIFEVPLAFLMDGQHHQRRSADFPAFGRRTFYTIPYQRFFIWGATAGMLRNLYHFLRAE